jgi:hypothetical protein
MNTAQDASEGMAVSLLVALREEGQSTPLRV